MPLGGGPLNTFGTAFRVTILGESHGQVVGCVVDGAPPGLRIGLQDLQRELDRRRPGQSLLTTQRQEADRAEILSGWLDGHATGAPILCIIRNEDKDSSKYAEVAVKPRPGHADYTARLKYEGMSDLRGGGMFSGRLTAALVMAGAIARKLLAPIGIDVAAHTVQVGDVHGGRGMTIRQIRERVEATPVRCADPTAAKRMEQAVLAAREAKDSVGGVVECVAEGVPAGLGEPWFDPVESVLAHLLYAIPAVKGVEFGSGFGAAAMRGSQHNDPFVLRGGRVETATNNAGGILGGITDGMPVVFRVAVKPASSIFLPQATVNLATGKEDTIEIKGRHDPCIVPRAVPVVEAAAAIALADLALRRGLA